MHDLDEEFMRRMASRNDKTGMKRSRIAMFMLDVVACFSIQPGGKISTKS
jgi:hypothetical protein